MFQSNQHKVITLKPMDAAIIFKEDGSVEASLPEVKTLHVPENILTAAALMYALNSPKLCALIREEFLQDYESPPLKPSNDF